MKKKLNSAFLKKQTYLYDKNRLFCMGRLFSKTSFILVLLFLVLAIGFAEAATLKGHVYNRNLTKLNDVVVVVNSNPPQRYIVKDSMYEFQLPTGNYRISARTFSDDANIFGSDDDFTVNREGVFVFDLVLEPLDEDALNQTLPPPDQPKYWFGLDRNMFIFVDILFGIIIISLLFFIIRFYRKKIKLLEGKSKKAEEEVAEAKEKVKEAKEVKVETDIENEFDENTQKMYLLVKKEKQITQKDVRKQFDLSEAKISLILTDLQNLGIIKRIKKGRGNVIIFVRKK